MYDIDFDTNLINLIKKEEDQEKIAVSPLNFVIKSAEGCYLIDNAGKYYLDLTSNKESNPLGYSTSNNFDSSSLFDSELFSTTDSVDLKNALQQLTGLEKTILTSSKAESYSVYKNLVSSYIDLSAKKKILYSGLLKNQDNYQVNNAVIQHIPLNNDIIAMSVITRDVGAVIVDIVQITEDVNIATTDYLMLLRKTCDKYGILLVIDATSVSPLRTLNGVFNYDSNIIKPDILILSSSAAQGIPFGAVILSDKLEEMQSSGSTICACKSALNFINDCSHNETVSIIKNNAKYLEKSLNELAEKFITIVDILPYGMLFTIKLDICAYSFVKEAFNRGIIIEALNSTTIKLSPPFNIGKDEVDKIIIAFEKILDELARFDRL